jgi:hypothetical protein
LVVVERPDGVCGWHFEAAAAIETVAKEDCFARIGGFPLQLRKYVDSQASDGLDQFSVRHGSLGGAIGRGRAVALWCAGGLFWYPSAAQAQSLIRSGIDEITGRLRPVCR